MDVLVSSPKVDVKVEGCSTPDVNLLFKKPIKVVNVFEKQSV